MCGIVAYIGRRPALPVLLEGLKRLEYRGYDSAGLAILNGGLKSARAVGRVSVLEGVVEKQGGFDGGIGIAHTRWATHGGVTEANAHPHRDDAKLGHGIAIIHNGIIENYATLKTLPRGEGPRLHFRDRHRGARASDRRALPRRPREGRAGGASRGDRRLRDRGRLREGAGRPRRRPQGQSPLMVGVGKDEYVVASRFVGDRRAHDAGLHARRLHRRATHPRLVPHDHRRQRAGHRGDPRARVRPRPDRPRRLRPLHAQGDLRAARARCGSA